MPFPAHSTLSLATNGIEAEMGYAEAIRMLQEMNSIFSTRQEIGAAQTRDTYAVVEELNKAEIKLTVSAKQEFRRAVARKSVNGTPNRRNMSIYPPLHDLTQPTLSEGNTMLSEALEVAAPVQATIGVKTADTWTRGQAIEERQHAFEEITSYLMLSCCVCEKRASWKCLQCRECMLAVHPKCGRDALPPCIPTVFLRDNKDRDRNRKLADYCIELQPRIPPLIIHCVLALEREDLLDDDYIRIYRSKIDKRCHSLVEQLLSSPPPLLAKIEPTVVAGCIKKFLEDLKDPVIPSQVTRKACQAGAKIDVLTTLVRDLVAPSRDTLAFLLVHWKKISENNSRIENLLPIWGPLVMGTAFSRKEQTEVIRNLLQLETEFLESFINPPLADVVDKTPTARPTPRRAK